MNNNLNNEFYTHMDTACGLFKESLDRASEEDLNGAESLLNDAYRKLKLAASMIDASANDDRTRMVGSTYSLLAKNFHHIVNRSDKALLLAGKSVDLLSRCDGADEEFFEALDLVARIHLEDNDIESYETVARGTLDAAERLYGRWHPTVAKWLLHLGDARREQNDEVEARRLHQEAVSIVEAALGTGHELVQQLRDLTAIDCTPPAAESETRAQVDTFVKPVNPTSVEFPGR